MLTCSACRRKNMPNKAKSDVGTAFEINGTNLDLKYFAISDKMER